MCTAGFWKDQKGTIHYLKNRMLKQMPKNQQVDFSEKGIFITDENGRFEGLNKYGLFAVSLTMEPDIKRKNPRPYDINKDILLNFESVFEALEFFQKESKRYDMGFIELLGNSKNVFYIEVTPNQLAYADLTNVAHFACTNHSQLLINQGNWQDITNSSHLRLLSAQTKLLKIKKYEDIKKMLSSHEYGKYGYSICSHDTKKSFTVGACIFTPKTMQADICINAFPCENGFQTYKFHKKD